jgi:hypothetical protein
MPAWRALMDFHACPIVKGLIPDVGGMIMMGSPTVLINSMMACRVMDMVVEIPGGPNPVVMGATNVCIGDAGVVAPATPGAAMPKPSLAAMPAAAAAQAQTLIEAAKAGVPFCEKCQHVTDGLGAGGSEQSAGSGQSSNAASTGSAASESEGEGNSTGDTAKSQTQGDENKSPELIPLSVIVHDSSGVPQEGLQVEVNFDDGHTERAQTNSMGNFVVMIKQQHESATIKYTIPGEEPVEIDLREDFFIDMPGTDADDGLRRRLHNLGYMADDDLAVAVTSFQATHGLPTTGEADQETREKLLSVHDGDDPILPVIDLDDTPLSEDEFLAEGDHLA